MLSGVAAPYEVFSNQYISDPPNRKIISRGAFKRSVDTGVSYSGKPIVAVLGHKPNGLRWVIGTTADGSLKLFETDEGLHFELPHASLPLTFTGVSCRYRTLRRSLDSPMAWRIDEAALTHIAILSAPDSPRFPQTFLAGISASRRKTA